MTQTTLRQAAVDILLTADPGEKVSKTYEIAAGWKHGELDVGDATAPERPARPAKPELLTPGEMPKRSTGPKGRIALIHALTHIELNAVDLAWDVVARFGGQGLPRAFLDDWVNVAKEEAEHFAALAAHLEMLGIRYGDFPAHDGLWQAAIVTAHNLAARMAIIPMTLEARGLETTPPMCVKLRHGGAEATAAILDTIYTDEIKHLAVGVRWFEHVCAERGDDPVATFATLLKQCFIGPLRPPFNLEARAQAGMREDYLRPWMA